AAAARAPLSGPSPDSSPDSSPELSDEQRLVVLAPPGPVLVLAGAGSGKTRVLCHRVAHLVRSGTQEARVLLMTFTNRAAREMVRRAAGLVGEPAPGGGPAAPGRPLAAWAGTFHHVALRLLR